ncbi:hypothetical protein DLJ47_20985 [Micromonospora sp. S4605]|nr:hypothetical protein DLJ47_20985 [Micromonospora sp. S4605]
MTAEGGDCIKPVSCGWYVAGSSCGRAEWCNEQALVEPGTWATDLGSDGRIWSLSKPPKFGPLDDGGYRKGYQKTVVPAEAIFTTGSCPHAVWRWLHP